MSHDRKPGRVRVVQAAEGTSRRRRGDGATRPGKAAKARVGTSGQRGQTMLIVLFLVASIGSAIAVAVQLPS